MKISYNLERKDVFAFQVYALLHNKIIRVILGFAVLLQLFNAFWYPVRVLTSGHAMEALSGGFVRYMLIPAIFSFAISMVFLTVVVVAVNAIHLLLLSMKFKNGDGSLGQHLIELNDEGLIEVTDVNQTSHSWKSVQRIVDAKNFILIYLSPTNAHIIPKRSFASNTDSRYFVAEAERLREQAKSEFSPSYIAARG